MRIHYIGPFAAGVDILATGIHADPGVPIEVPDDLGAQLCEQAVWEEVKGTKPTTQEDDH